MTIQNKEEKLIKRLNDGDAVAFDELFELFSFRLYGFALKYLKSDIDAEELVQETFVKIWENRKSIKSEYSFKSYLFTIALNQIRKLFKKKAVALKYISQINTPDFDVDNKTVDSIEYSSVLQRVDEIIETLPERKKLIFLKSRKEGLSSREIATQLNITSGAVDNQISDAIKIIRGHLSDENLAIILFLALFYF